MMRVGMHTVATASQNARLGFMRCIMRLFFQGVKPQRSVDWRNIAIALVDAIFCEQKAQTCENACFHQPSPTSSTGRVRCRITSE